MATTPPTATSMPYVWAGLILFLMAALFIVAILWLRPALDPLVLITSVVGVFSVLFASISAYLKSEQTHVTVNSQLTAWKAEFFEMAHAKGMIEGAKTEQDRVAEQTRLKALPAAPMPAAPAAPPLAAAPPAPVSVVVQNVEPVPVKDVGAKAPKQ